MFTATEKKKTGYRIEETEAVYIRRIYAMSAGGAGGRKIAKEFVCDGHEKPQKRCGQ